MKGIIIISINRPSLLPLDSAILSPISPSPPSPSRSRITTNTTTVVTTTTLITLTTTTGTTNPAPTTSTRTGNPTTMPHRPTFEYNPLSYSYPDDESDKELFFLQASGAIAASHLRTVLLYWVNKTFNDGEEVWQVVRLDRKEGGGYKYVYPDLIVVDGDRGMEREREHEPGQGIGNGNGVGNGNGNGHAMGIGHWHGHGYSHGGHDRGFGHGNGHGHDREHDQVEDDERGELVSLGTFTRDQREALLECAEEIEYDERAEEWQCLRWMGTLLDRMIDEGLVKREVVDTIRGVVALPSSSR